MESRPTEVVTCFLRFRGKILLVKRSGRVGTYQSRWSGISGYLPEGVDPLSHAYVEIQEETGLNQSEVSLVMAGPPVPVNDAENNRRWLVHPFLFETATDQISLDWENLEPAWIDPTDIETYPTVPGLVEVYASASQ